MKKHLHSLRASALICTFLLISFSSFSGKVNLSPGDNRMEVVQNNDQRLQIRYHFSSFSFSEIKTPAGIFTRLQVPQYSLRGETGGPEFPVDSRLIELPYGAEARVRIIHAESREYRLDELGISYPVYPKQAPVSKSDSSVPFEYFAGHYQEDAYQGEETVTVEVLGSMRGVRIARLDVSPIQYNPVRNTLKVCSRLEVEIVFEGGDAARTEYLKKSLSNHYFQPVFENLLNYRTPVNASRDTISRYPVKYVIISDPMFEDPLQPFIEWKTRKGFEVIEAYTNDPQVGTTTLQIKAYLQSLYDNASPEDPAPTFVLFVGDIQQVPTFTGIAAGHVTDLYYVEYTNDLFPEMYYGRFSAQNTSQLQPQIDKTLMYEQFTMPDPAYLEEVVMIAGMDGTFGPTHGNGQINYGTINYFNSDHDLLSHTYLYPESGSNSANIRQNISDGVTLANYTAHGSPSGWADPSFTTGQIAALENEGKYGLLVGNCCSTSEYQVGECFGEALLRAENKGALGYIGASNSTYWDEDYYFGVGVGSIAGNPPAYEETTLGYYDRAFHDHGEPFAEWYTTMDQMIYAGNLAVTLGSPGMARYYWEAYCLMGDPSLMVYLGVPAEMTVSYDALIPLGSPSFTVTAAPYAYVALSMDGVLLGAGLADSTGAAIISLEGVTMPGMAEVVATAQNYIPFTGTVLIANPEGPYVLLNQWLIDDTAGGNGNGQADHGESILLDTELKNWGGSDAVSVTATLTMPDTTWVMTTDDYQEFGTILAQDSVLQTGAYEIQVLDSIPDQSKVHFNLTIEDQTREVWSSYFSITLNAPVLSVGNITIIDTLMGNGNGKLDPGETVDVIVMVGNTGHCHAMDALALLSTTSAFATVGIDSCQMDTLAWGNMYAMPFTLTVSEEAPAGSGIDLTVRANAGPYSVQKEVILPVGLIIEDFETGDFESFGWLFAGNQPWTITSAVVHQGEYAAVSGDIGDSQTSVFYLDMSVPATDSISFYFKVSCEDDPYNDNYDFLAFFIDDQEMGRWDGEVDWSFVSYPVEEGTRTFKWVYSKDYSVSSGSDAAWVDDITFPGTTQYVGTGEVKEPAGDRMRVHPNPVSSLANVTFLLTEASEVTVRLIDLTGRQLDAPMESVKMGPGEHMLPLQLEWLPAGAYFIVLETRQGIYTRKVIKN